MMEFERFHASAVMQHRHVAVSLYCSSICGTCRFKNRQNVHPFHATRIVEVLVAEHFDQRVPVCIVNDALKINWIYSLNHPSQKFSIADSGGSS